MNRLRNRMNIEENTFPRLREAAGDLSTREGEMESLRTLVVLEEALIRMEEERDLEAEMALELENGFPYYLRKIGELPIMDSRRAQILARRIATGDLSAKEEMIISYLQLASDIAGSYHKKYGLSFDELVSEGNMGLVFAAEQFDWNRNVPFSPYARMMIRKTMDHAVADRKRG